MGRAILNFLREVAGPFGILFPIVLTVTLTILVLIGIDRSMLDREVYLRVTISVLGSAVATVILLIFYRASVIAFQKSGKRMLAWITMQTVRKAIINYNISVPASGIGSVEGSLVVGLDVGSEAGIKLGDQFIVSNTTSREIVGVLEVVRLREELSVCGIIHMTNPEFWNVLEQRMDYDPSFPRGITISRNIREDALFQFLHNVLESWRG